MASESAGSKLEADKPCPVTPARKSRLKNYHVNVKVNVNLSKISHVSAHSAVGGDTEIS